MDGTHTDTTERGGRFRLRPSTAAGTAHAARGEGATHDAAGGHARRAVA